MTKIVSLEIGLRRDFNDLALGTGDALSLGIMTNNEMRDWLFRKLDEKYEAECMTQYQYRCKEAEIESRIPENDEPYQP